MTNEEAAYILHEMKSINFYEHKLTELRCLLIDISERIESIQMPSCPLGGDGTKIDNHKEKSTIVNSLLSDEQMYVEERNYYSLSLSKANGYVTKICTHCSLRENQFLQSYIEGWSQDKLRRVYGYANPYQSVLALIKKTLKSRKVV